MRGGVDAGAGRRSSVGGDGNERLRARPGRNDDGVVVIKVLDDDSDQVTVEIASDLGLTGDRHSGEWHAVVHRLGGIIC